MKSFSYKSFSKKSATTQKQVYANRLNTNYIQQTDTVKEILCLSLKPLEKSTARDLKAHVHLNMATFPSLPKQA